ncbi:PRC-barrel domain containing protein [Streptomyces sp. NPDC047014]|uniref:PRC-barrel domain containing protein n=1 Tax=Streptomyces sp. NPDC047014 TaxID=3155736 RepID=UPI0033E50E21
MSEEQIWGYHEHAGHTPGLDLVGYKVEATDGTIGRVDKHSEGVDDAHVVVDTGLWIFGKRVLLPAGVIDRIDTVGETVHVARTKEQIKNAPDFDEGRYAAEPGYREEFARHYGQFHS